MDAYRNFSREGQGLGDMASAEHQPIMGLGHRGSAPSGTPPWAEPMIRRSGPLGAKPHEAEGFEVLVRLKAQNFAVNMPRPYKYTCMSQASKAAASQFSSLQRRQPGKYPLAYTYEYLIGVSPMLFI